MAAPERLINEYTDVQSGYIRTSNWISAGSSSGPLNAAIQAAMNGAILFSTQGLPYVGSSTPVGGQYQSVQDVALFAFATVPGTTVQLVVPTPINAMFGANSTIIDPTNALAAAIIAQALLILTDAGGNAATAYAGGSKASRRTEQL